MKHVPIGRVLSTRGLKGEVKFHYYNDEKEVFHGYTSFFIKEEGGWSRLRPEHVRFHNGFFLVTFEGFTDVDEITPFIGKELYVKEDDLPPPDEDEYYEYQLMGLEVFNGKRDKLGTVEGIIRTGRQTVLVVKGEKETLIPMVDDFIIGIDLEKNSILVSGEDLFQ